MIDNRILEKIVKYCQQKSYLLAKQEGETNIVYVEGMDVDGNINSDAPNQFNDVRILLTAQLRLLGNWSATTEPGRWYTEHPLNPKGAARIAFGQYKAWQIGKHGNSETHEALVQVASVKVYRDRNKDELRTGDSLDEGLFGINQHWGYDLPSENVGKASAGCLVGRSRQGHKEFMALLKRDVRYLKNQNFIFPTTIIPGDKL